MLRRQEKLLYPNNSSKRASSFREIYSCTTAEIDKETISNHKLLTRNKSKNIPDNPLVGNFIRRKRPSDKDASNKQKSKRPFPNEDGDLIYN